MKKLFLAALIAMPLFAMARQVVIETRSLSLVIEANEGHQPQYVYFGQKLSAADLSALPMPVNGRFDAYPPYGMWPQSAAAVSLRHADGNMSTQLYLTDVRQQGSLTVLTLKDPQYPTTVTLNYLTRADVDMIETWTEITNGEKQTVTLTQFASGVLPIRRGDVWLSHLYGSWANEGRVEQEPLTQGVKMIVNRDGARNSHTDHAEVMFSLDGRPQELSGDVIGAALCYWGNYKLKVVTDDTEYHYFFAGIDEENSEYHLKKGETFQTPHLALTFSKQGLSGVSRNFHRWGRKYMLANGSTERKILLNSWEGVYFDINQKGMDQMMGDIASMGGSSS